MQTLSPSLFLARDRAPQSTNQTKITANKKKHTLRGAVLTELWWAIDASRRGFATGRAVVPPPSDPNYQPSVKELIEAEKMAKTAASSISFEDIPTAVKYLQDALKLLTSGKKPE